MAADAQEARGVPQGIPEFRCRSRRAVHGARRGASAGRCRHHPQPAQGARGDRERAADSGAAQDARLIRAMARLAPSADQGRVGEAVPQAVRLHRRRDRRRVPDEHRLSARRPPRRMSGAQEAGADQAALDAGTRLQILSIGQVKSLAPLPDPGLSLSLNSGRAEFLNSTIILQAEVWRRRGELSRAF